jgi:molybdopterin/thiamine biosynthesis adenylyltransferase
MASNKVTTESHNENAITLAAALGLSQEQASKLLTLTVLVTTQDGDLIGLQFAQEVSDLLVRTVESVTSTHVDHPNVEIVIGVTKPRTNATAIYVSLGEERAVISSSPCATSPCQHAPKIFHLIAACYASAMSLYFATGSQLPSGIQDPLNIIFNDFGVDPATVEQAIDIGHAYLVGAGAIGNGLLWAARHLNFHGRLEIVDDDDVSPGNLNRQVWFDTDDIGQPKASRLVERAQSAFPNLKLVPREQRLQSLQERNQDAWLARLIVAVDSRRARRSLQREIPGEVFDASTTDIREVVVHYHKQPNPYACLSCIYEQDEEETTRERHIADHLGVSIEEVKTERISQASAEAIVMRFPKLSAAAIVGTAYDSLFKTLCAESELKDVSDNRVVAPFSFVSVLAGSLLALELVRRLGPGHADTSFNYWRLSPWHAPLPRRRSLRPKQLNCEFCNEPILVKLATRFWENKEKNHA